VTELEEQVRHLEREVANASAETRAPLLARLGSNLVQIGQRDRGLETLSTALALLEQRADRRGLANCLNRIGCVHIDDEPDEARTLFQRALGIARELGERSDEATCLHDLAILDELAGALDFAIARYKQSIHLLRELDERDKLATTLNAYALALDKHGQHDAARATWDEVLAIARELRDDPSIASTLNNLGAAMERGGDVEGAIRHYREALAIQDRIGEVKEQLAFLGNLRLAYLKLGRRDDSLHTVRRILAIQQRIDNQPGVAEALHKLADTLAHDGITPEADEHYATAIAIDTALGDTRWAAFTEIARAEAWSSSGDHVKALAFGEHALGLLRELGNGADLASALDNVGLMYSAAGDHATAIAMIEHSLALVEQFDPDALPIVLGNLAEAYLETDQDVQAIACHVRIVELAEANGDRDTLVASLDALGLLHTRLADDGPAIAYTRRALALYESRRESSDVERLRARLARLQRKPPS
jgi:tetratricopeptide (TPR) repeat protein